MVRVPHLFVDPAERAHVSDFSLLELPEIGHPTPVVNMVDIRQIGGDSLSTIREESTGSTGSTRAITNPCEEEFPAFPLALEAQSSPSALTNHPAKGRRTKREPLGWKETPIARLAGWSERMLNTQRVGAPFNVI
jgi:hypothetical protein